jgi:hypothetical protein
MGRLSRSLSKYSNTSASHTLALLGSARQTPVLSEALLKLIPPARPVDLDGLEYRIKYDLLVSQLDIFISHFCLLKYVLN